MKINERGGIDPGDRQEQRRRYNRLYQRDRRAAEKAARWLETMARIERKRKMRPVKDENPT